MIEQLKASLKDYLSGRKEIIFALLYGSAVEDAPFHDLDVGLLVDRERIAGAADLDYSLAMAEALTRQAGFPTDVRVINDAPLGFRYNVSRGEPLMVNDEEALAEFRERTWDEFFDFAPVGHLYLKELCSGN